MPAVFALRAAGGKPEHPARIDGLQRQAAGDQGIEHTVERDAVGVWQLRFEIGMTQGLSCRRERIENAHAPGRDLDAGGANKIGSNGHV